MFIVFCGKKEKKHDEGNSNSIFIEIKEFQKMCFVGGKSLIITGILITITYFMKKIILANSGLVLVCSVCGLITFINTYNRCFFCC